MDWREGQEKGFRDGREQELKRRIGKGIGGMEGWEKIGWREI